LWGTGCGVTLRRAGGSHARILLQKFAYSPALVAVEQADRQAYAPAVSFDDADIPFILGYLCDLIYTKVFFKKFGIPPYCQDATIDRESVDEGSEVKGQEQDPSQYKNHYKNPKNSGSRAVGKQLYSNAKECQPSQKPEYVLLRLVSQHKLVHQVILCYTAKGIKMLA
jgi:hypothetical protein